MKFRFPYKGVIAVEDLWDLPVEELDSIYKALNASAKKASEESLLTRPTKQDEVLDLKIEIIKYIVETKMYEERDRKSEYEKREKRQKLMSILAIKQDEELKGKSADEIKKMLDELN
jgi:hypothetical protein